MQRIIGVCGQKGSGKDTIGEIICKLDPTFKKVAFADTVKDLVSILFGWDREMIQGSTPESREWREQLDTFWTKELHRDFSPRIAMQLMGTDLMRNHLDKNIWIICLKRRIMNEPKSNFVITDARFPNEVCNIERLGGKIIRVERGERPNWWSIASKYNRLGKENLTDMELRELEAIHPSERDWIDVDKPEIIFHNDSTIEDLEKNVKQWLETTKWE